jgi:hypothetical protein
MTRRLTPAQRGSLLTRAMARLAVSAVVASLVACTPTLHPAPPAPPATPSPACVDAWDAMLASPGDRALAEAPVVACRSLEEFVAAYAATHGAAADDPTAKLAAQSACETGRFNDTPICRQLGIAPSPTP